jgi:oxygen-independent coproporphyrinogen-3 oxidase
LAGIYIHIPFCRQACHYCNFHFATSLHHKNDWVDALLKEIRLQKDYLRRACVGTIYFGGGTPSLLDLGELSQVIEKIKEEFTIDPGAEITLEANPDDITEEKLKGWKEAGINRLSIGVQSFFEEDLQWMNRAHTAQQAIDNLRLARKYFDNITIDLIYGTPQLTNEKWKYNVDTAIALNIPHLSCYALTVELKTPLDKMIRQQRSENINPDQQSEQFLLLMQWMEDAGYEHYEISNFAKPGWRSHHNSAYWSAGPGGLSHQYLGLGPSAHSFNGSSRQWNIANNHRYIESINEGMVPFEKEELTATQRLNEYIMTALRTVEGVSIDIAGPQILERSRNYITGGLMKQEGNFLILTREGKLLADGIAAELFY